MDAEQAAKFVKDLSPEQQKIALKVAEAAIKNGLNPEFVLPLVKAESRFDPNATSERGAIGVMQLIPKTAKGLKVDPNDLDQNIEGGMKLIKELMTDKRIGSDPYNILVAYNTSTDTRNKYFETRDIMDLPKETRKYMLDVTDHYGKVLPSVVPETPKEAPQEQPAVEPAAPVASEAVTTETPDNVVVTENNTQKPRLPRALAGVAGASVGASLGAGAAKTAAEVKAASDIGQKLFPNFKELVKGKSPIEVLTSLLGTNQPATTTTTTTPEVEPVKTTKPQSSGQKWGENWGNFEAKPGSSVPEAGQQWNKMQPQGKITKGLAKRFGPTLPLAGQNLPQAPTEAELLAQGRLMREMRYQDYLNSKAATGNASQVPKSTMGQIADKAGEYLKYAKYPLAGAFHGFNVGQGTADVLNRLSENKPGEAALSALGTAAGSAALHTAPMLSTPLAGAASIIPAYLYTRDHPSAKPNAILNEIKEKGGTPNPLDYVFMPAYIGAKAARGE